MSFTSIVGHKEAIALLRRAVDNDRVPAAYLLVGPPNVGKTLAAIQLAKALNCEQPADGDCCDECDACQRTTRGIHPNFRLVRPLVKGLDDLKKKKKKKGKSGGGEQENERDNQGQDGQRNEQGDQAEGEEEQEFREQDMPDIAGGIIKIDVIRDLIKSANAKAAVGKRKVYVITSAEAMQEQQAEAANCFLRTLEEPPGPTTFILTSANISDLLPTIVSRCQLVNFHPVPHKEAIAALRQEFSEVEDATIEAVVASSAGRYGWAYRLLQSEQALSQRKAVLDLMASLPDRQLFEGMRAAELLIAAAEQWWLAREGAGAVEVAKHLLKVNRDNVLRTQMNELTDVMFAWWRDLSLLGASPQADKVINTDYLSQLRQLSPQYNARACRRACRWIQATKAYLPGNANLRLSAEALMMKLISL